MKAPVWKNLTQINDAVLVLLYRSAGVSANIYLGITGENALTYVYVV
jgi:hypothetical protein